MKFAHTEELREFLRKNNVFPEICSVREIYLGGSSFNFHIKTQKSEYFLKVLSDKKRYEKLSLIWRQLGMYITLKVNDFMQYKLLAQPYLRGRKMRYKDFDEDTCAKLSAIYEDLQNISQVEEFFIPFDEMDYMHKEIERLFEENMNRLNIFYRIIYKFYRQRIQTIRVQIGGGIQKVVIHGDLTSNNVLVSDDKLYVIDFDNVHYGFKVQDFAALSLQLAGFRAMFGNLYKLKKLLQIINKQQKFTLLEWLYGVQLFYLHSLLRKLNSLKSSGYRKSFCFFVSVMGYFRVEKFLHKYYKNEN